MLKKETGELKGVLTCEPINTALPMRKYVFQKTRAGHGNVPGDTTKTQQVRIWVRGANPRTELQKPGRIKFAVGVGNWQAMSEIEKAAWDLQQPGRWLNRFQQYMRWWMISGVLPLLGDWDDGASSWDGGDSVWDVEPAISWDSGATHWDGGTTIWIE
jgi:hypothetical protein